MKVLWLLILAIMVTGAVAAVVASRRSQAPEPVPGPSEAPGAPMTTPAPTPAPSAPTAAPIASAPAKAVPADGPAAPPTPAGDLQSAIDGVLAGSSIVEGAPKPAAADGTPVELPIGDGFDPAKVVPVRAQRLPDGSLRLDQAHTIRGSGSKDDPYVVPFDLLISAENTYQPRKGLTRLPQRVTFMHGAWVRLTGYVAFPITAGDATEMLVMQNQWDGCCIGVPPTAYDAVEVKLAEAAAGEQRLAIHGSVLGRFKVDPYVDNNYLLGLYVLEHASFSGDLTDKGLRQKHNEP
jgi:hypothetical protein